MNLEKASMPKWNIRLIQIFELNLSTAAKSVVYWRYTIINQIYAAIVDFILIFVVKDTQKLSKSRTRNPKPGSIIPWTPIQSFWYIEYGIIYSQARI